METSDRDDIFVNLLAGLDADLQGRVLDDWLSQMPSSRQELLDKKQVHSRVLGMLGIPMAGERLKKHGPRRCSWLWIVGTAAMAIVAIVGTPNPVSAALSQVLHFIPGIGQVQQTPKGAPVAVLPHVINGTWKGSPIQVTGMMMTPTELVVELSGNGPHVPGRVWFRTAGGRTISLKMGNALTAQGSQMTRWTGNYNATGRFGALLKDPSGTVIMGERQGDHIAVQLNPATSAMQMSNLGPTQVHHGVSLTAIATQSGTEADLTFVAQYHGPFVMVNTVPRLPMSMQPDVQISDATGRFLTPTRLFRFAPNSQLAFTPVLGVASYRVVVPEVEAMYTGKANVTLPVPDHGSERVNKTVTLGGLPIEITTVRRVGSQGGNLRMYWKLPDTAAGQVYALQLNQSWASQSNSKTGVVQWMQVRIRPAQHSVTLQLSNPHVYIRGPWIFSVHTSSHRQ